MTILPFAVTILRLFWSFYCSQINFFYKFQYCGQNSCEMEDFRGIADESFPSFYTNSLISNSGILENVTLFSNLGLPVAVSTLARHRSSRANRYPDVQASYLVEERFSVPSESSLSGQSDSELRERLQLSFEGEDSPCRKKNYKECAHLSHGAMQPGSKEEQANTPAPFQGQHHVERVLPREQVPDSSLDLHLQPWMNNQEQKIVVADTGNFQDKTPNSDCGGTSLLENEKLVALTSLEDSSDDDINDEEFYDAHLEAYFEQLAIPGMIYEDVEERQECPQKDFKLPSSDHSQDAHSSGSSGTTHRESEEGHVCLPGTSNSVDTRGNGRQEEFFSDSWRTKMDRESSEEDNLLKILDAANEKLLPICIPDTRANKDGFDLSDSIKQKIQSSQSCKSMASDSKAVLNPDRCLDTETPTVSIQKNVGIAPLKPNSDNGTSSTNHLWSPTSERRACDLHESSAKPEDQTDVSQNVVYQNEEGRWVTDLAYYTSFTHEQELQMSPHEEMNEDFRSGSEALDLIAQGEEEFNREHQFIQEENIDANNTSAALGDASWLATVNYNLLKKSLSPSEFDKDAASYLRLSLGEFFAERSEALGCLGGGNSVKRPSFGYFIRSPEKREPFALLRKSDMSRSNLEKEMAHLNHGLFSGDLNEGSQTQLSEGSVTLQAEALQSPSQAEDRDETLTAHQGQAQDTLFGNKSLQVSKDKLSDSGDSVLRISTIASAIADVSVSTDPAQLVNLMKTLTNKTRGKTSQNDAKRIHCPTVSHCLTSDLEQSNGASTFDMEKYLAQTDVGQCEDGLESFPSATASDVCDLSLCKEQTLQDVCMMKSCAANRRVSKASIATVNYGEDGESETQESLRATNSSSSLLRNTRDNKSTVIDIKTYFMDNILSDVHNSGTATSVSTPASSTYLAVKKPRMPSVCLLEKCDEIREDGENCGHRGFGSEVSSSDKHVTFEERCIDLPQSGDLKTTSPLHDGFGLEEDQDSFRPSTSPLSHSSPSEISGASLSGCALESLDSVHRQNLPCESELSQLACSHTDMSRLTYVSEQRSTFPTSAADEDPQGCKSDVTNELSTTIIRASPTPSEEQTVEKLDNQVKVQIRGKRALPCITQIKSSLDRVTETTSTSSRPEGGEPNFTSSQDLSSKSGEPMDASEVELTSDRSEQDLTGHAVLSKPGLSHWAGSDATCLPVAGLKTVDQGQTITSEGPSLGSSESGVQVPNQSTSGNQCIPAPHIPGHDSVAKVQNMPTVCPPLWTGQSLHTAPLVQQYLGIVPSAVNATLTQCYTGSASVCGISGCSSYPAVAGEHMALGICVGPNHASGLMGPSSLYNPCSNALHPNLRSTAKPFPVHSVSSASGGTELWDSGAMAELGSARVPEELKFPHACCVGIASQTLLSILNPTDRWLQVSIRVLSVSIDGEKVDLPTHPCLVFKNKVIIRPHATEEIKILFIPCAPGIFRCMFSVASWPFSADVETVVQAEALGSRVILTAVAETPAVEVETEKKGVLDFGDLTYEGWKALPLKLINRTHAAIPVRLIINANTSAWRCFSFSKEPIHTSLKAAPYAGVIAQLVAPSVVSHVMPASYDGQDSEFLIIWVLFHSPKKRVSSSEILDPAEEFLAKVDIEVDSPNPTPVLRSVGLRARAGIARIHAPRDLQTVHLLASMNSSAKQHLPLKNAGNIEVYLDIKVSEQGSHFSVDPESLFLKPGEEHEVVISFTPKNLNPTACEERTLKILVQPFGPQYEVVLKGQVSSSGSKLLPPEPSSSDTPSILSNKQFLTWGGVPLGRTQLQKLALRSGSTSTTQYLRLLIKGQDQDCFQLQSTFGSEERLTNSCEVRIRPEEDLIVSVLFAPTRLSCMLAKLEIKQLGNRSQPGIKFIIPLSGYGGTSNLILENVKKLSDSYMVTVNGLIPGRENKVVFSVRNTGSRAAFVRAVGFKDSQKKVLLDPKVLRIVPDKFVLKENTQEDVTLIYNPSERKNDYKTATELSTIYFFGGDEISRQQYRRALLEKPEIMKEILPEHSVLHSINFAEAFQDELLVDEAFDLPQRSNDIQLFYGSMRKIVLSVIGEFRDSTSGREYVWSSSETSLSFPRELGTAGKHGGNVALDVLPVKGPQGSPFLSDTAHPSSGIAPSEEMWAVQPEHLILLAPSSCDMIKTGHFLIINHSVTCLKFELYWPAHCLTVTPQHGFVAPESKLQILVSPNSSLSSKQSMFPWSGLVYVHSDNGQKKIVKVQIREDLNQDLLSHLASSTFGVLASAPEPSISHLTKPVPKPPSTKVELKSKMVILPTTEPGKTSENCLEFKNHGPTDVKWHLSSFAPPYVKDVDESGDVFRATYTAFRCSPISGILGSHGIQKVSIMFLPRDRGDYAQFWDVECHPVKEPHMKHTLRFQLSGQSIRAGNGPEDAHSSKDTLIKVDPAVMPRRHAVLEASAHTGQHDLNQRGVYAPKDVYMFLPTKVGESRMLKVNLRNNSFYTHLLKFSSPREPFYIKHSKYSLRARHYIHIPVHFRPEAAGRFAALLVIHTDEGKSIAVRLIGEALEKSQL
uniref:centrosomal protein of 192 kDa isoform X3 n=1 Tax=Jaculus jaculus TaxID=51337 RepID=UPI001E1AFF55|nr:centrosomal protein of 192 kDa isoform X3 [Jaculus jaculus]